MPAIWIDRVERDRKELDAKKEQLSQLKTRNEDLSYKIKVGFTEDGAITREGLNLAMIQLDIERRSTNPLDQGEQSLIQGQQSCSKRNKTFSKLSTKSKPKKPN